MNITTLSRRTAAAGVASALVAGALVGATSTAAQAAPIANQYLCTSPIGEFPVWLNSDAPMLDPIPQVSAGQAVPGGLLTVSNTFTVPQQVRDSLAGAGIEDLAFPDFAGEFGGVSIPVQGVTAKVSEMTDNGNGTWSVQASEGTNGAFETPAAGTYDVLSPDAFAIAATLGEGQIDVACTIAEGTTPESYKTLPVLKNASSVTATGPKKAPHKGDVAKIRVTINAANETPSGKVILKRGKKTVAKKNLNDKGKATLKTRKLRVGKNKLRVIYKGDDYTEKSKSEKFVVKVKR